MILNGHIAPLPALTTADKNDLLYQLDKFNNRRNGGRFNSTLDNSDYINKGPAGKELYKTYSMRRGGYRSYLQYLTNGHHPDHQLQNSQYLSYGQQKPYGGQGHIINRVIIINKVVIINRGITTINKVVIVNKVNIINIDPTPKDSTTTKTTINHQTIQDLVIFLLDHNASV